MFGLLPTGRECCDGSRLHVLPSGATLVDRQRDPQPAHPSGRSVLGAGVLAPDPQAEQRPQIIDCLERCRGWPRPDARIRTRNAREPLWALRRRVVTLERIDAA